MAIRKSILLVRYVTLLKDLYKIVEVDENEAEDDDEEQVKNDDDEDASRKRREDDEDDVNDDDDDDDVNDEDEEDEAPAEPESIGDVLDATFEDWLKNEKVRISSIIIKKTFWASIAQLKQEQRSSVWIGH